MTDQRRNPTLSGLIRHIESFNFDGGDPEAEHCRYDSAIQDFLWLVNAREPFPVIGPIASSLVEAYDKHSDNWWYA